MKKNLLVWLFTLCLLAGLLPPAALAAEPDAAFEMPVIGFKVRMNERGEDSLNLCTHKADRRWKWN